MTEQRTTLHNAPLTMRDVAERLGVSLRTWAQMTTEGWIERGGLVELPRRGKRGSPRRFTAESVERAIRNGFMGVSAKQRNRRAS